MDRLIYRLTNVLASTPVIVLSLLTTVGLSFAKDSNNAVNIGTILLDLLILRGQGLDTKAVQKKLDGLVETSDASNELVGMEKR